MIVMETAADGYRSISHCCGVLEHDDFAVWSDIRGIFPWTEPRYLAFRCNLDPRQFLLTVLFLFAFSPHLGWI